MEEEVFKEGYLLPDNSVTKDPVLAAEEWYKAFCTVKDALSRIRPVPSRLLSRVPVVNLDEILAECDHVLSIGE